MAAAVAAIAVPPMPVKWTDLISDENIAAQSKSGKPQIPSTKLRRNSKPQTAKSAARFGAWSLEFLWSLVLGAFLREERTSPIVMIALSSRICEKKQTT